jgi:esterase/lipase superfamily enzyme
MGNRALVNAVYRIATERRTTPVPRFNQMILTAPDIDANTFVQLAQAMTAAAQRVTLYASSNDEALKASRAYQGYQRAGDSSPDVVIVTGVDTVDVSTVDTSLLGHSYYGDSRSVLSDIFALVREGKEPGLRVGIRPAGQSPRLYWAFGP